MARAIKQTRTTLKIKRDTSLYDTGFSSQDQWSRKPDVVSGTKMRVKVCRNMLRMEVRQDLHLALYRLGNKVRFAKLFPFLGAGAVA